MYGPRRGRVCVCSVLEGDWLRPINRPQKGDVGAAHTALTGA